MNESERELLAEAVAGVLTTTPPAQVPAALADLGWADVVADDEGGACELLFGAYGRTLCTANLFDDVILDPLRQTLPGGGDRVTVGYPNPVSAASVLMFGGPVGHPIGDVLAMLPGGSLLVPGSELRSAPVGGIDPDLGLRRAQICTAGRRIDDAGLTNALARGRAALATSLTAIAETMLGLAVQHATSRLAFGKLLGEFQAVQQRLADAEVAVLAAASAVEQAWRDGEPASAVLAKSLAGAAHATVARQAQQILGGMGFTWEHPFHRFLRRGLVLDTLLGSGDDLARQVGRDLAAARAVPRVPALAG